MIYLCSNTPSSQKNIINLNLCQIKFNKFSVDLNQFDAVIFTSKNAVKALEKNQIKIPKNIKVFSIGSPTSKAALDAGFEDIYTSPFHHGNDFAKDIDEKLKGLKIAFFRAKEVVSKIAKLLNDRDITEIIAYENIILENTNLQKPPKDSIIVFTSPKNVRAFIQNFGFDTSYKAIAIGNATAKPLMEVCEPIISKDQTIEACLKLAKNLI